MSNKKNYTVCVEIDISSLKNKKSSIKTKTMQKLIQGFDYKLNKTILDILYNYFGSDLKSEVEKRCFIKSYTFNRYKSLIADGREIAKINKPRIIELDGKLKQKCEIEILFEKAGNK